MTDIPRHPRLRERRPVHPRHRQRGPSAASGRRHRVGTEAAAPAPALPFEARALARFYTTTTTQEFRRCLACGGEWPCDIVTACANCHGPKE